MFKPGTVVKFDPNSFNQDSWKNLTEDDKIKYYGYLGYGGELISFIFLCEISNAPGHCVLLKLDGSKIETMVHMDELRELREDEV